MNLINVQQKKLKKWRNKVSWLIKQEQSRTEILYNAVLIFARIINIFKQTNSAILTLMTWNNNVTCFFTSFSSSPSKSVIVREVTLSPVTVQNGSFPSLSNPCMEQFPPIRANGDTWCPNLPMVIAFAPSDTCRRKIRIQRICQVSLAPWL